MLVQGGQQALSGVANKRLGYGATGGFSNMGSISDIYDRLGTQLSQLGQESRQVKETKRDVVAQSYQAAADAERDFQNNQKKAEAAIIAGDIEAANRFMQAATEAEVRMRNAQADFTQSIAGNVIKGGLTAGAYALGGPAAAGGSLGAATGQSQNAMGDVYTNFSSGAQLPGTMVVDPFAPTAPVRSYKR
jgi:hypothetical protein